MSDQAVSLTDPPPDAVALSAAPAADESSATALSAAPAADQSSATSATEATAQVEVEAASPDATTRTLQAEAVEDMDSGDEDQRRNSEAGQMSIQDILARRIKDMPPSPNWKKENSAASSDTEILSSYGTSGWMKLNDKENNVVYYANADSGETSWRVPEELLTCGPPHQVSEEEAREALLTEEKEKAKLAESQRRALEEALSMAAALEAKKKSSGLTSPSLIGGEPVSPRPRAAGAGLSLNMSPLPLGRTNRLASPLAPSPPASTSESCDTDSMAVNLHVMPQSDGQSDDVPDSASSPGSAEVFSDPENGGNQLAMSASSPAGLYKKYVYKPKGVGSVTMPAAMTISPTTPIRSVPPPRPSQMKRSRSESKKSPKAEDDSETKSPMGTTTPPPRPRSAKAPPPPIVAGSPRDPYTKWHDDSDARVSFDAFRVSEDFQAFPDMTPLTAVTFWQVPQVDAEGSTLQQGLPQSVVEQVSQQDLSIAAQHFRTFKVRQGGMARKSIPLEQVLSWQPTMVYKSLLNSSKKYNDKCLKLNKYLMGFMGDLQHSKTTGWLAQTIVSYGVNVPAIRDEVFCQICKQTRNNPNLPSVLQGWKLMALCVSAFPPSKDFERYLINYIILNYDGSLHQKVRGQELVATLAPWCFWRLHKTLKEGSAKHPINLMEVDKMIMEGIPSHSVLFGSSLDYLMTLQQLEMGNQQRLPSILPLLCETIKRLDGFNMQGIFRIAAEKQQIFNLKAQLERGDYVIRTDHCHVPADVLKIWLRELHEPLFPKHRYQDCMNACDDVEKAVAVIQTLPQNYKAAVVYLLDFLAELAEHQEATSMDPENIAIVFCTDLVRPPIPHGPLDQLKYATKEKLFIRTLVEHWMRIRKNDIPPPSGAPRPSSTAVSSPSPSPSPNPSPAVSRVNSGATVDNEMTEEGKEAGVVKKVEAIQEGTGEGDETENTPEVVTAVEEDPNEKAVGTEVAAAAAVEQT
eukprot:gb/GEZN01001363.1/.p1 GENE.gb/GEZN01001363.1/~~gb/GEZN01001363.1/.p1  ORF type:complete len:973 (+),score=227.55 gb/GEZN01001363.1/:107-3025(+)